jgi:hypothetical protein
MPSKTKNRRAKGTRRHRKGTRSQRGGDWLHTLSLGLTGTADAPSSSSTSSSWSDWLGIKSDTSGKSWWDRLTSSNTSSDTNYGITTNPMQPANAYTTPDAPDASTAPDSSTVAYSPESSLSNNEFRGGKKSKSKMRKCHHKHKHTKSCSK